MGAFKQAVIEMFLLGLLSAGLAFGVNAVRKDGHIKPTKDYFAKGVPTASAPVAKSPHQAPPTMPSSPGGEKDAPIKSEPRSPGRGLAATSPAPTQEQLERPAPTKKQSEPSTTTSKHLEHPYKEISLDEVLAVMKDPQTARGLNVFVDARKEDDFAEGHIPGAVRCFPYEVEKCINKVLDRTNGADKVIVYCGGGDCEDSIFMCRELVNAGVPSEAIHLYAGGWKEWSARNEPVQSGAEE